MMMFVVMMFVVMIKELDRELLVMMVGPIYVCMYYFISNIYYGPHQSDCLRIRLQRNFELLAAITVRTLQLGQKSALFF